MIPTETTNPTATSAPTPTAPAPSKPSNRYSLIFGVALTVVTVAALALAFLSSDFRPRASTAVPSDWTQAYNADLTAGDTGKWDESQGCSLSSVGLDAAPSGSEDAICAFRPSLQDGVTTSGFYFVTQLAPAAKVSVFARAVITIGDITSPQPETGSVIHFIIGQDGNYTLCDGVCSANSSALYQHGGLAAWHGDDLIANTIAIKVSPDHSTLTVYVNDQEIASTPTQFGVQPAIAVGATSGDEAIFTHATLYTGQ